MSGWVAKGGDVVLNLCGDLGWVRAAECAAISVASQHHEVEQGGGLDDVWGEQRERRRLWVLR